MTLYGLLESYKIKIIILDDEVFYLQDTQRHRKLFKALEKKNSELDLETVKVTISNNLIESTEISQLKGTLYRPMKSSTLSRLFMQTDAKFISDDTVDTILRQFRDGSSFVVPNDYTLNDLQFDVHNIEELKITQSILFKNRIYYLLSHIMLFSNGFMVGVKYYRHAISLFNRIQLMWVLILVAIIFKLIKDKDLIDNFLLEEAINYTRTEFYLIDLLEGNLKPSFLAESIENLKIIDSLNPKVESIEVEDISKQQEETSKNNIDSEK